MLGGRRFSAPRGRTPGGASAITGMIQIRGQPEDFDGWEAMGAEGWNARETLRYFIKSETNSRGANAWHGDRGPLAVSGSWEMNPTRLTPGSPPNRRSSSRTKVRRAAPLG